MMRYVTLLMIFALIFSFISMGCSGTQKVIATQETLSVPYDSLGWVEVNRKAPRIQYRRITGQLWEWMTFGHSPNISQEVYLQGLLNEKLVKASKEIHNAEKVIHVKYWPDLNSKKFPQGLVHVRGEAIRYKRFSE